MNSSTLLNPSPYLLSTPVRHTHWHERLLLNKGMGHLLALTTILASAQLLGQQSNIESMAQLTSLGALLAMYIITAFLTSGISRFPGGKLFRYSVAAFLISMALVFSCIAILQLPFSMNSLVIGMVVHLNINWLSKVINHQFFKIKLAYTPSGFQNHPVENTEMDIRILQNPKLGGSRYDGLVIDSREELDHSWLELVAKSGISGIPVLDARHVHEIVQGKVPIESLNSSDLVNLQPSQIYLGVKRLIDIFIAIALVPLILPLCLILGIAIMVESPGWAIYSQLRTGKGNKPFKMYKLRSMRQESSINPRFANEDQHRITKLGKWLRKYRLDELPQLFNVLKGEMSLIGPRPEQPAFVDSFSKTVPFYTYRHVVMPGITGWAQVNQGYTFCVASTKEKVEHDFYYIKHLSIWLDIMIMLRTIRTVLTGSGAM